MRKSPAIPLSEMLRDKASVRFLQPNLQKLSCFVLIILALLSPALKVKASPDEISSENRAFQTPSVKEDLRELKPGETIERAVETTDINGYQIALEVGSAVEITLGKRGIPIQLTTIKPDGKDYTVPGNKIPVGKELARLAAGSGDVLVEPFVIVANETGNYIIKANFLDSGTYSISCGLPHQATEKDRKYAAAGKIFAEIRRRLEAGESPWKMRDKFEERAEIYRSLGDKKSLALSLNDVGFSFGSNAEWGKVFKYYKEALELFRSQNSLINIIDNLFIVGRAAHEVGDYQTAIDSYSEVLALGDSQSKKGLKGAALHQLGVIYHLIADEQKAREFYEQSLSVRRSVNPPTIDSLNGEGITLTNIGNLYRGVGGGEIAIDFFTPRTVNDRQKALEYYQQALEVAEKTLKLFPKASTLKSFNLQQIGNTYKELGNYSEALKYLNQSLELYKSGNRKPGQTNVLVSIGNLYVLKGEYQKGFEYFEQALALLRAGAYNVNQIGYTNSIARDYYQAGETRKALDLFNEALTLSRNREQHVLAAESLFEIARIERDLGNFNNARNGIEEAIQTVESLRARITSQNVRTTYFSTVKRYYDFYIDLLMQAHKSQPEKDFDALALQMGEKARSRSLLDLLTLSKIDVKQGVNPALLEREQQARERLSEKANQQSRLLLAKHTKEEAEKISKEVSSLTAEYETIQAEIKNKSPRYAALTQPSSLNAKQIQQLLDDKTILLEYSLGEKKSYLWAVSSNSIISFDLPARELVEAQARKVYELLTARNLYPANETEAQRRARLAAAETEYPKSAGQLSQMLLGDVAQEIVGKRLLIVPDGALNYLPFAALIAPKNEAKNENGILWQPLAVTHEIINLPSASVLALLREESANRQPAPKMLAVYADPVFDQTDARFGSKHSGEKRNAGKLGSNKKNANQFYSRDFERAINDVGLSAGNDAGLPRLAFSRREADSIFNVSPKNLSLKAVDFKASKSEVINSNVDQYRILHFATHGLLNSQHPELSGVVLSLVDRNGNDVDGFLRLQDIYNLKLSADLVVLSACNTALGKDVKGEGLIGLTRGFMYAGAPRMVASLWKVDDAATAELMSIFYRKMLAENLRPAAALRAAQTEMMKQQRWKSPYYWAPFVIQGEWK